MRKHFLIVMLIILSMGEQTIAQEHFPYISWQPSTVTRTDATFNTPGEFVQHRHMVTLEKGAKIIFELSDIRDYDVVQNLDSIISRVCEEIDFYGDSISSENYQSVRVDYVADNSVNHKQIRFTKYPFTSDIFLEKKGEISKLKIERDTVRIRIYPAFSTDEVSKTEYKKMSFRPTFPIQITLILSNYNDLKTLNEVYDLNRMVDTLSKLAAPKTKREMRGYWAYKTTAQMSYTTNNSVPDFRIQDGFPNEHGFIKQPGRHLNFYGNIGVGLVRNKLAPMGEAGLEYRWYWVKGEPNYASISLFAAPYFIFEKNVDRTYHTYDSWFINAAVGEFAEIKSFGKGDQKMFIGVGYLVNPNGMAFRNTTMKLFMSVRLMNVFTIAPEIIFTDNFKSIFPGLAVKVF